MATSALPIQRIERRMRGGSQSLFVRDADGNPYIAKCIGNPQGTRTLINEWVVSRLLKYLRVSTPEVRTLRIERGIPGDNLMEFQIGNQKVPIAPGVHLGSRCPVDPERKVIFDFLPSRLLHKVGNLPDLLLAFVFDKWVNQTDTRQAIFIRERSDKTAGIFRLYLIDHGHSFGGSRWEFGGAPLHGLYRDRSIYENPNTQSECHAAVERIQALPEKSLFSIEKEIPVEWLQQGDCEEMSRLFELLCGRRTKLHDTVDRALRQMNHAGFAIPMSAEGRRLLGAVLLFACVRGAGSLTGSRNFDIELCAKQTMPSQPGNAPSFDLIARSRIARTTSSQSPCALTGAAVNQCGIRIWRDAAPDGAYFLHIYNRAAGDQPAGLDKPVAAYTLLVN
jgi:hypothetical protein